MRGNYRAVQKAIMQGTTSPDLERIHIKKVTSDTDEMVNECLNCDKSPEYCEKHCSGKNKKQRKTRFQYKENARRKL